MFFNDEDDMPTEGAEPTEVPAGEEPEGAGDLA